MEPFAYDLGYCRKDLDNPDDSDYTVLRIFPRLIDLYRYITDHHPTPINKDRFVLRAWYDHPTAYPRTIFILDFVERNELDVAAIRNDVRKALEKEQQEIVRRKEEGRGFFSGECWLHTIGEDSLVENVIKARQYSWLPMEKVDWNTINARLVREDD